MINDIYEYDLCPGRSRKSTVLVLSVDKEFKNRAIELYDDRLVVGFEANTFEEIQGYSEYFNFFTKIIENEEVETVLIDSTFYSIAVAVLQSLALNSKNVRYVLIYVDENDKKCYELYSKDNGFHSSVSNKERTYRRQEFFDS